MINGSTPLPPGDILGATCLPPPSPPSIDTHTKKSKEKSGAGHDDRIASAKTNTTSRRCCAHITDNIGFVVRTTVLVHTPTTTVVTLLHNAAGLS